MRLTILWHEALIVGSCSNDNVMHTVLGMLDASTSSRLWKFGVGTSSLAGDFFAGVTAESTIRRPSAFVPSAASCALLSAQ